MDESLALVEMWESSIRYGVMVDMERNVTHECK